VFKRFKLFAHDVKAYVHDVIRLFKEWNYEKEKVTIVSMKFHDSIDKMVEKEMAQLKSIKEEEEREEMARDLYNYECSNCKYSFSSFVCVVDVVPCCKCTVGSLYMLPQSDGVDLKKVEHKDVMEVLSKFSTEELVEALKLKEDVQAHETTEDTHKVSMDLMKVKKHVLIINNCNPQLVEHRRRALDNEMIKYAGVRCD